MAKEGSLRRSDRQSNDRFTVRRVFRLGIHISPGTRRGVKRMAGLGERVLHTSRKKTPPGRLLSGLPSITGLFESRASARLPRQRASLFQRRVCESSTKRADRNSTRQFVIPWSAATAKKTALCRFSSGKEKPLEYSRMLLRGASPSVSNHRVFRCYAE